ETARPGDGGDHRAESAQEKEADARLEGTPSGREETSRRGEETAQRVRRLSRPPLRRNALATIIIRRASVLACSEWQASEDSFSTNKRSTRLSGGYAQTVDLRPGPFLGSRATQRQRRS